MVENEPITEYRLTLGSADGRIIQGVLRLDEGKDILTLEYMGRRLEAADEDYFEAFCRIRENLEAEGLRPLCYGASRNVCPSQMSRQMGGGIRAYKLTLGQPGRIADLVDIFAAGEDMDPVSVTEQREFHDCWLASLRRKP
jgi:hypothetical protein